MLGRRGFMTLLGLAPMAAQAQLGQSPAVVSGTTVCETEPAQCDPVVKAARRFLNKVENREDRHSQFNPKYLPPHIGGKRSWSPAFKKHVHDAEHFRSISAAEIYLMDDAELIQFAIKRGWGGLK